MVTDYTQTLRATFPWIERAKKTSAGFIVEARLQGQPTDAQIKDMYERLATHIWSTLKEVLYSFYTFSADADRFVLEGVLRKLRTDYAFNMSTSTLGADDIFVLVPRFDFDQLTLGDYQGVAVLFQIAQGSPAAAPLGRYTELDLQGHQFPVQSNTTQTGVTYTVEIGAGLDMT